MSFDPISPGRVRLALLATAIVVACVAVGPVAAASNRNYLTVQGRVMNHLGEPVRDAG